MITVTEYFVDDDIELRATFAIESMASAIGCDPEHAGAFRGEYVCELQRCVNTSTRKEHEPSAFQLEQLENAAIKQIHDR